MANKIFAITTDFCSAGHIKILNVIIVTVLVPPNITDPVSNTSTIITEGDTITITCEALGYPLPTIVWSKTNGTLSDRVSVSDNVPIGNGNETSVSVNLTLTNVSREDTGLYQCTASNSVGNDIRTVSGKYIIILFSDCLCI